MHFDSVVLEMFIYILIGCLYVLLYTFASFLFSYKIYLVSSDRYTYGALISGLGLFINFSLYAFVPFIAVAVNMWWLSLILLFSLGIGSFLANAVMGKVDLFHMKDKEKPAEEEIE